jgi:acyl-CoA thioesterase-1
MALSVLVEGEMGFFRMAARNVWVIVFVLLAACGRQEEAPRELPEQAAKPVPAPAATTADGRPVIACFGDSLTAGFGLDPGQSYPDDLQQKLPQYRVANFGVSGDTSQDGLERLPMVLAEKPAIVVVEFGANDGLRGQPISNTQANLSQMIETLQKAGVKVVLAGITLPPNYGPEYIRKFEGMYKDLATKYKTPLIPFLLAGVAGNRDLMQRDGLHPTAEGARLVAGTVFNVLRPMVR